MNLVKCNKGHYYDKDKFEACPHCQSSKGDEKTQGATETGKTVNIDYTVPVTEPFTMPDVKKKAEVKKTSVDDEKTVGYYFSEIKKEPVVGWLVCIEGETLGDSFNLKSGKNFIGRNIDNDIVITGDNGISREKHAVIVYDPKSRKFLVQPGMSSELFYVNDSVILQAEAINQRDVIQLGKTKLMFMPFCGENFTWDDYVKENS